MDDKKLAAWVKENKESSDRYIEEIKEIKAYKGHKWGERKERLQDAKRKRVREYFEIRKRHLGY